MITQEREYAQNQVHVLKNRNRILILAGLLAMALILAAAHPVQGANYISLGDPYGNTCVSATNNPWTLSICPANATNYLPDQPDRALTITLSHNNPVPSCDSKEITVTTTYGVFLENGLSTLVVKTDKTCSFTATVFSYSPGVAVITATKGEINNEVSVWTNVNWTGTTATPSLSMQVTSSPILIAGENANFAIQVKNTGNINLSGPTVMVDGISATYVTGDEEKIGTFEPSEVWQYSYSSPVTWNSSITFDINATAWYGVHPVSQDASYTYTGLLIEKSIPVQKFSDAYGDLPFNVTAQMSGDETIYGPFQIQVNDPAEILVQDATWMFTETGREVTTPYRGNFVPQEGILTYQPGDEPVLSFVNDLQYLQVLEHLILTEHEVEINLSAGETSHTLYAIATDQYGEPYPYLNVTFADAVIGPAHAAVTVTTNESGIVEYTYSSAAPGQMVIYAFVDANRDTYFENDEIGDSCTLTWIYIPVPGSLSVQGDTDVTNYLDYDQFDHTFNLTLTDQYGFPMNDTRVEYSIDYENGSDVTSFGITDADGNISIIVSSLGPDVAHIIAEAGTINASMTKTWTYEIPPTTLTFTKSAKDVNEGMLVVGDTIRYTLTVNNTGINPAYFVKVVDNLPDTVTCQDVGGDSSECADPYIWDIGEINPGTSMTLTINATIDPEAAGQSIINTGTIEGRNFPPIDPPPMVCPDGSHPVNGTCGSTPVLATTLDFTKTAVDVDGGYLVTGDVITYTLTVTNTGDAPAYDVIATDNLPENVTCLDVGGNPASCSNPVVWNVGVLDKSASMSLTINVSINADAVGLSIVNTGLVTGGNVHPVDPAQVCPDNSAPVDGICPNTPIPPWAVPTTLSFTKSAEDVNGGDLEIGDLIRYTLIVTNIGGTSAYNVMVTDNLPDLLACQDVQGASEDCADTILWYIGQMEPGATAMLTINTTILPDASGKSIINTGLVSGQNFNPVEPSVVCPDGSAPVGGACNQTPVPPETEPGTQVNPPSGSGSHGSYSIIRSSTVTVISTTCQPSEYYVEGMGCIHCEEDEIYIEGQGCVKNETPLMIGEPPVPSSTIIGTLITLITNPLLILVLLALLAAMLAVWWRRQQQERPPAPGPMPGGEITGATAAEVAYTSVIRVLNEIEGQLAVLERGIRAANPISPQEAARMAESFFYTSQLAEEVIKDPEIRQFLSAQQIAQLNAQLQISVQKMHALSRSSENLLNAVQMQYVQAQL